MFGNRENVVTILFQPFIWLYQFLKTLIFGIINVVLGLYSGFSTFLSYLPWLILLFGLYYVGVNTVTYAGPAISQVEHFWRCDVQPVWLYPFGPFTDLARNIYNRTVPKTNALALIQRLLSITLFIDIWRFDFIDWIIVILDIGTSGLGSVLKWTFLYNPIYNAFPAYSTLIMIANQFVPASSLLMVDACAELKPIFDWINRVLASNALSCALHQLINVWIGGFQHPIIFVLDFLTQLFNVILAGGNGTTFSQILKGEVPGDTLLPSLTSDGIKEKLASAGVYIGIFLNDVFAITICSFKSEMNANGDANLARILYFPCIQDPSNRLQLFGIIGPVVAATVRFSRIWYGVLINMPTWVQQIVSKPIGKRYLIDDWYLGLWSEFFDTIRPPPLQFNYSVSVNYPTVVNGSGISTILWPNPNLYGDIANNSCNNFNNSRRETPCLECGEVAQIDAQTIVCQTCADLDNVTAQIVNITLWTPWICCGVASYVKTMVAIYRFFVGVLVYTVNYDRLGLFLADQNHYDTIANEFGGSPYDIGGLLGCLYKIAVGFDPRLNMLALMIITPIKAQVEAYRLGVIAVCRFVNDIVGTGEPGFAQYACVTDTTNCIQLERSLSHLRRPRDVGGYDPYFEYISPSTLYPPGFDDAFCYVMNFQLLASFMSLPPSDVPDFCCFPQFLFRTMIEQFKMQASVFIASLQTIMSIFVPSIPFNLTIAEFLACISPTNCINIGALISEVEDFLDCPCLLLDQLETLMQGADGTFAFFCICDFITGVVRFIIYEERANMLILSCIADVAYCLANGWPAPHCKTDLPDRFFKTNIGVFADLNLALDAMATAFSSIGCTLGLPWVGAGADCIGHKYIWFYDSPPCVTSTHGIGVCTMSDRLRDVTYYIFQFVTLVTRYAYNETETLLKLGFEIIDAIAFGFDDNANNSIAKSIIQFFLIVRTPLFGTGNQIQDGNFTSYTQYSGQNTTGVNNSRVYNELIFPVDNRTYVIGNWTYKPPPSYIVYNFTVGFSTNTSINASHGLIQAMGETLNCLVGPDTDECRGPMIFGPYPITGETGCLGDLPIAAANGLRDVYTAIITFIGDGLYIIEAVFINTANIGNAVKQFIIDFFVILMTIVQNAEIIINAAEQVIIQVVSFIFGDGAGRLIAFFLDVIVKVIDIFINVIEFLLAPFLLKRNVDAFVDNLTSLKDPFMIKFFISDKWSNCDASDVLSGKCSVSDYSSTLSEAYFKGQEQFFDYVQNQVEIMSEKIFTTEKEEKDHTTNEKRNNVENSANLIWSRKKMNEFNMDDVNEMTDGFCKEVMTAYNHKQRFVDFTIPEKFFWKGCFIAWSLPNEFYAASNGELQLPKDFFYNLETSLSVVSSATQSVKKFFDYQSQQAVNDDGINTYTQLIDVPQALLDLATNQHLMYKTKFSKSMLIHDFNTETEKSLKRSISDMKDQILSNLLEESEINQTHSNIRIKRTSFVNFKDDGPKYEIRLTEEEQRRFNTLETRKKDWSANDLFKPHPKRGSEKWIVENQCYLTKDNKHQYCIDGDMLWKGFEVHLFETPILKTTSNTDGNDDDPTVPKFKLPPIPSHLNQNFKIPTLDDKSIENNPFLGTNIQIYTSMNGQVVFNISKLGRVTPVLNGKIAITRTSYTFEQHLDDSGLNNEHNLKLINFYRNRTDQHFRDQYLKLHSTLSRLSETWTKRSKETKNDDDLFETTKRNVEKETKEDDIIHTWLPKEGPTKPINNHEAAMKKLFRLTSTKLHDERFKPITQEEIRNKLREPLPNRNVKLGGMMKGLFDSILGFDVSETESKPNVKENLDTTEGIKYKTRGASSERTFSDLHQNFQSILDLIKNKPTITNTQFSNGLNIPKNQSKKRVVMTREEKIEEWNKRHYAAVAELKKMGVWNHYFKKVIPQSTHHVLKSIKAYFSFGGVDPKLHTDSTGFESQNSWTDRFISNVKKRFVGPSAYDELILEANEKQQFQENFKDTLFWILDKNNSVTYDKGEHLWNFESTSHPNQVVDMSGYVYSNSDIVYVIFDDEGKYKTYKDLYLTVAKKSNDRSWIEEDEKNFSNKQKFEVYNFDPTRMNDPELSDYTEYNSNGIKIIASLNYYENYYQQMYSKTSCFNGTMWLKRFLVNPEDPEKPLIELHPGSEVYKRYQKDDDLVVQVVQCFRKGGMHHEGTIQKEYGHILKGKSIVEHRMNMIFEAYGGILHNVTNKFSLPNLYQNTKKIFVDPWINKVKETYQIHKRTPTLTRTYLALERIREGIFNGNVKTPKPGDEYTYFIPKVVLAELGHPIEFSEQTKIDYINQLPAASTKRNQNQDELFEEMYHNWKNQAWSELYESWSLSLNLAFGEEFVQNTKRSLFDFSEERRIFKRGSSDLSILNICLPKNASIPGNVETTCDNCEACEKSQCAYCDSCNNCTLGVNGTASCEWCANCRIEGPYCKGGCQRCTGCSTQVVCLDCLLAQRILPPAIFYVEQAFNPSPLQLKPGVQMICVVPFDENTPAPIYSNYGFNNILNFISDYLSWGINKLVEFNFEGTLNLFMFNQNLNPIDGCTGAKLNILRRLGNIFYKCNYDVDTMGTIGLGLKPALKITGPVTIVVVLAGLLIFPQVTMLTYIVAGTGIWSFFVVITAQVAWYYNYTCFFPTAWNILMIFGYAPIPISILPQRAANEIYDLLNEIFQWTVNFIPACITTNGVSQPTTCDEYLEIIDFKSLGFFNGFNTLMYFMQAYLPPSAQTVLVTWVNQTCLVQGGCLLFPETNCTGTGLNRTCVPNGPLAPIYQHNFLPDIQNATMDCKLQNSFYILIPSLFQFIFPLIVIGAAFLILYALLTLLFGLFDLLLMLIPEILYPGSSLAAISLGPNPMSTDPKYP